jgi:hypothetical protein
MGIPPARGIIPLCVCAGCFLSFLSVISPKRFANLIVRGVTKNEINVAVKNIRYASILGY